MLHFYWLTIVICSIVIVFLSFFTSFPPSDVFARLWTGYLTEVMNLF